MIDGNPFVLVYDALWDLVEASALVQELVRTGNMIKMNRVRPGSPMKDQVGESDLPELMLLQGSSEGNWSDTSSTSRINRQYEWGIATGDFALTQRLAPVEWAIFAAMVNWRTVLTALRWPADAEDGFVKVVRLIQAQAGVSDAAANRGIAGWSGIWTIEVQMHFANSDLVLVGEPDTGSGSGS